MTENNTYFDQIDILQELPCWVIVKQRKRAEELKKPTAVNSV